MNCPIYEPSGKLGFAPVLVPTVFLAIAPVYAAIYALLTTFFGTWLSGVLSVNNLFVFYNFLILVVFIGATTNSLSRCRNSRFWALSGAFGGLVSIYFAWVYRVVVYSYIPVVKQREREWTCALELIRNPSELWSEVVSITQSGSFAILGYAPPGYILWLIWTIEACVIVVIAGLLLYSLSARMFCETCLKWAEEVDRVWLEKPPGANSDTFAEVPPNELLQMEKSTRGSGRVICHVLRCPTCGEQGLRFTLNYTRGKKKGEVNHPSILLDKKFVAQSRWGVGSRDHPHENDDHPHENDDHPHENDDHPHEDDDHPHENDVLLSNDSDFSGSMNLTNVPVKLTRKALWVGKRRIWVSDIQRVELGDLPFGLLRSAVGLMLVCSGVLLALSGYLCLLLGDICFAITLLLVGGLAGVCGKQMLRLFTAQRLSVSTDERVFRLVSPEREAVDQFHEALSQSCSAADGRRSFYDRYPLADEDRPPES